MSNPMKRFANDVNARFRLNTNEVNGFEEVPLESQPALKPRESPVCFGCGHSWSNHGGDFGCRSRTVHGDSVGLPCGCMNPVPANES
jgi:hypothetical protein